MPNWISRIDDQAKLFQITQTTGMSYSTAVHSTCGTMVKQPSPAIATTGRSGAASLAPRAPAPDRPVVANAGDGCFTMVPHVLCTAVEYDIPVVWVIWNNFGWVSIRDIQLGMFGGR